MKTKIANTKIQKWGNSLAVRIPKDVTKTLRLKEGNAVVIHESGRRVVITPIRQQRKTHGMRDWRDFVVPTGQKTKENVSGRIDEILYGRPH